MKTGYSFGSLASFVETINNTTVKLTGNQTIAGIKTFSSNPISSAAQGTGGSHLTRKDYVDGALALKAPLASPVFTGDAKAPTAALFDADTTIATTAFVQRASGNHQSYVWTGDATIQPGWAGCFIWYAGAGTLSLPKYPSVPVGATFEIMCTGTGAITAQAGEQIILPNGAVINSFTPLAGDTGKFVRLDTGWAYSGSNYCATAATGDRSTRPASTQFVRNYLESSPSLAGNVHVEGGVNITQEFATTNAIGYRIAYGNYGAFWYFDEWNMYLMFTNSGDKWGAYNGLRPFSVNCRTGNVAMSNGAGVSNGLSTDSFAATGNAAIDGRLDIKQYSFIDGGWWRGTQPFSVDGNYASGSAYEVHASQLPLTDSFFPIVGATTDTIDEGYQVRVKFGVYSKSGDGGWGRKHAGIWVGNGESTTGPRYLYKFNIYGGFYCNAVVADTTITAGTNISAGDTIHAPRLVSSIADQPGLRFTGGPYGVICYNDNGESFHFLLTNANDQWGSFNNLRPFTINKRTGLVTHQQGLSVSGMTSLDTLTVVNGASFSSMLTANTLVARASYNTLPVGTTSFTKGGISYHLGISGDLKPFMVLMCPVYSGTTFSKSGLSGKITLSRGTAGAYLIDSFVDFSIVGAYSANSCEIYHQNAGARIVTVTYNSIPYYALYFDALSAVDVIFDGIRYDQDFTPTLIPDATGYNVGVVSSGESYARLSSPSLTGTPTTPTAAAGTNTSQIASTAFVNTAVNSGIANMSTYNVLYSSDTGNTTVNVSVPSWCRSITIMLANSTSRIVTGEIPYPVMTMFPSKELYIDYGDAPDWIVSYTLTGNSLQLTSTGGVGAICMVIANR